MQTAMEANEVPQSSSFMLPNDNAQLETNSGLTYMEVHEQHVAEMKKEIERIKFELKRVTKSHKEEIERKNKQFAGLKTLKRELDCKVAELSNNLQIQELDLGNQIVHRNIEIIALKERVKVLEEQNKGLNKTIEELQGHPTQNAHEQRQGGLQLLEPELEEPSSNECGHPEIQEQCQNNTREEHVDQTPCSSSKSNMRSEQPSRNAIMEALSEIGKKKFNEDGGSHIHLLRIVHTSDSVSFRFPDVFHLSFRKQGDGSVIQSKDEVSEEVITKIAYTQLVKVFLKMLLSDSNNIFVYLMLETSDVNQPSQRESEKSFLRLLVEVLGGSDQLLQVHYLYTTKYLLDYIAKYMDPNRLESITILETGGVEGEEFDEEFLRSPVWRNLKRFASFDEFSSQNILKHCEHISVVHVVLKEKMKIEEILEMKEKFLRTPHSAYVSIYFESRTCHSFMESLFAKVKRPLTMILEPEWLYGCFLDEDRRIFMAGDQYGVEFRRRGIMEDEHKERSLENYLKMTQKLFEDALEKRGNNSLIPYIMDQDEEEFIKYIEEIVTKYEETHSVNLDFEEYLKSHHDNDGTNSPDSNAALTTCSRDSPIMEVSWSQRPNPEVGPGSSKRLGGPMEEQPTAKRMEIEQEEPMLEQQEELADTPEAVPQGAEPFNRALHQFEPTQNLPARSAREKVQRLKLLLENSSEEYKMECLAVLNAAVSRFSGPKPPKSANQFFDEIIRKFQISSLDD
ncbi:unnamed protein product [Caenorhabditis brenneri]